MLALQCMESQYINSRPFRVNAGPVHSYIQSIGNKTAYLSELKSGSEVLVVDPEGRQRTATVGRVKIESRPLVLLEARTGNGQVHSVLLQNAETVRVVGPCDGTAQQSSDLDQSEDARQDRSTGEPHAHESSPAASPSEVNTATAAEGAEAITHPDADAVEERSRSWHAISVCDLKPGDLVHVFRQDGARHTGISIKEAIVER